MYINPNSTLKVLKGIPLNPDYEDTIYFANKTTQAEWFASKAKYTFNNLTYQRYAKGVIRIQVLSDNIYDCNYLMFQNTAYGNKWFYAFITNVEYINDVTSEISYEIDVMQTWYFDYVIEDSFVERQHSATDNVGDNIISENLDIGDLVCDNIIKAQGFEDYSVIMSRANTDNSSANGKIFGGFFTGLDVTKYDILKGGESQLDGMTLLRSAIWALMSPQSGNQVDSVVSLMQVPTDYFPSLDSSQPKLRSAYVNKATTCGGRIPRNKKLLTYPFSYLDVTTNENDIIYKYEWFNDTDNVCRFSIISTFTNNLEISVLPLHYNGSQQQSPNYQYQLTLSSFPQCAFAIDGYRAWIAEGNLPQTIAQGVSGVAIGTAGLGALGYGLSTQNAFGVLGGVSSVAQGVMTSVGAYMNYINATRACDRTSGNPSGGTDVGNRSKAFYFRAMSLSPQYSEIIDSYFDRYGYMQKRTYKPTTMNRPYWSYLKTIGCNINALSMPADDARKIAQIYDKGVTHWRYGDLVGDFSQDNTV